MIVGFCVSFTAPCETGPTAPHAPPVVRCSSVTPVKPRIMPPSVTAEPYATGVFGLGAASDSTRR